MEITIKRIWKNDRNPEWTLKGRVDVDLACDGGATVVTVNGVAVNSKDGKTFIGMPQTKGTKVDPKTGKIPYYDIVKLSKEAYFQLQDAILAEFGNAQVSAPVSKPTANTSTRTSRQAAPATAAKKEPAVQVGVDPEEDPPF